MTKDRCGAEANDTVERATRDRLRKRTTGRGDLQIALRREATPTDSASLHGIENRGMQIFWSADRGIDREDPAADSSP